MVAGSGLSAGAGEWSGHVSRLFKLHAAVLGYAAAFVFAGGALVMAARCLYCAVLPSSLGSVSASADPVRFVS